MNRRPLSIVIISLIYFFEPFGNLITAAYINQVPLLGFDSILSHLIWADWIILCLFPIVAIGIYSVKKWGWYLFIFFSILLVAYNLFVYAFMNPNYNLGTVLIFIVFVSVIAANFLRKHVYSPYFNPRLRWWEIPARYRISLNTKILTDRYGTHDCKVFDISVTGCFIDYTDDLEEGDNVWLIIQHEDIEINCLGKIVRKSPDRENILGYGIIFKTMSRDTRSKLKLLLHVIKGQGGKNREETVLLS